MHKALLRAGIAALAGCCLSLAHATLTEVDIFRTAYHNQTDATTVVGAGYDWDVRAVVNSASDFDSGTITYPGSGSPQSLTLNPSPNPLFETFQDFTTQADMDAAYPTGDYTVTLNNSGTAATASSVTHYTHDAYPGNTPQLDAASFNDAQGMDAHNGFDFSFNTYDIGTGSPNDSLIFFTLYDAVSGDVVFTQGFLNATTTNVSIAANTLEAGKQYAYDLDFSNRFGVFDQANQNFSIQGWDSRTDGFFSTAADNPVVPEPASLSLIALGCGGLSALRRRKKK